MTSLPEIDVDMALLAMPFVDVLQPPLGVSVLCGALRQQNIRVKALYPAMMLAEQLPYDLYSWFGGSVLSRLGDYFFSNMIFGRSQQREAAFLAYVRELDCSELTSVRSPDDFVRLLPEIQRTCNDFIDTWADRLAGSPRLKVVACSATYLQLHASLALLQAIKRRNPKIMTVIGGCECEGQPGLEIVRAFDFVDYVFSGEGEIGLPKLAAACIAGLRPSGQALPYGAFDREKALAGISETPMMTSTDFGPIDHRDYWEAVAGSNLFKPSATAMSMEFSRGCWKGEKAHCTFCGLNGERISFRHKDRERILRELESAYAASCRFFFVTDTIFDMTLLRPVLQEFSAEAPQAAFLCEAVSTLSEDQLKFFADCGIVFVQAGIESLHPRHVELMNKRNSPVGSIAYLKFARENLIHVFWNFLACIPGDKPEEYRELNALIPLLEHLQAPGYAQIRYDRYSEYWKRPAAYGLRLRPLRNCQYLYPADSGLDLERLSMYFENGNEDAHTSPDSPELTAFRQLLRTWAHSPAAKLEMAPNGTVTDTRRCAVTPTWTPSVCEASVLRQLRTPHTFQTLRDSVRDLPCEELEAILEKLMTLKVVIFWDEHYLSLVTIPIDSTRAEKIKVRIATAQRARDYMNSRFSEQLALLHR